MIRNRLAELLSQRQLKISRVAHDLPNLSRNTITNTASNSGKMIQLETIDTLCRYLQVTPAEFFDYIPYNFEISIDDLIIDKDKFQETVYGFDIKGGGLTFTLYITVSGSRNQKYVYEYNGELADDFEYSDDATSVDLTHTDLNIHLNERVRGNYSFGAMWKNRITAGFRPIISNEIKHKIGNTIVKRAIKTRNDRAYNFGPIDEIDISSAKVNFNINIESNFYVDLEYSRKGNNFNISNSGGQDKTAPF